MKQPTDIQLRVKASLRPLELDTATRLVVANHYLHRPLHPLSRPYAYGIWWDEQLVGVTMYARPHFARMRGWFAPYGEGQPLTNWQVLVHSRLWIADDAPRNLESWAMRAPLRPFNGQHVPRLVTDYLQAYPPIYPDQPFSIRLLLGWTHDRLHPNGTIYRASGWQRVSTVESLARKRHGGQELAAISGDRTMYSLHLPKPPDWWLPAFRERSAVQQLQLF